MRMKKPPHSGRPVTDKVLSIARPAACLVTLTLLSGCSSALNCYGPDFCPPPCYGSPYYDPYARYCRGLPGAVSTPYYDDPSAYAYSRW